MKPFICPSAQALCREAADDPFAQRRIENATGGADLVPLASKIFHLRKHLCRGAHHAKAAIVVAHRDGHGERDVWVALDFLQVGERDVGG